MIYDRAEARRLTGVTQSQFRYWHKVGLVRSAHQHPDEWYGRHYLDTERVVVACAIRLLRETGTSIQMIRRCFNTMRRHNVADHPSEVPAKPARPDIEAAAVAWFSDLDADLEELSLKLDPHDMFGGYAVALVRMSIWEIWHNRRSHA